MKKQWKRIASAVMMCAVLCLCAGKVNATEIASADSAIISVEAYEIEEGEYIAPATDVTELLGTDALIDHQNQFVSFTGMTVEAYDETGAAFAYKNEADKTDDLYFKVSYNGQTYDFCVEYYLCGSDTDVYKAVENLKVGDVVDMQGFLYWYEGANPHITSVTVK